MEKTRFVQEWQQRRDQNLLADEIDYHNDNDTRVSYLLEPVLGVKVTDNFGGVRILAIDNVDEVVVYQDHEQCPQQSRLYYTANNGAYFLQDGVRQHLSEFINTWASMFGQEPQDMNDYLNN